MSILLFLLLLNKLTQIYYHTFLEVWSLTSSCWQGCVPFRASKGKSMSLPFSDSRGPSIPGFVATFSHRSIFLLWWPPALQCVSIWIISFSQNHTYKGLLLYNVTYSWVLRIRSEHFSGTIISLPQWVRKFIYIFKIYSIHFYIYMDLAVYLIIVWRLYFSCCIQILIYNLFSTSQIVLIS